MSACGAAVCHVHARVQVRVHVGVLACAHVCVCTHCGTLMNGNCCVVRTVVASMSRQKKHCAGLGAPAVSFMHVAGARSDDCLCMWLLVSVRFFEGRAGGARTMCVVGCSLPRCSPVFCTAAVWSSIRQPVRQSFGPPSHVVSRTCSSCSGRGGFGGRFHRQKRNVCVCTLAAGSLAAKRSRQVGRSPERFEYV